MATTKSFPILSGKESKRGGVGAFLLRSVSFAGRAPRCAGHLIEIRSLSKMTHVRAEDGAALSLDKGAHGNCAAFVG